MIPLNSYSRENKHDLFFRQVPKLFCLTLSFISVTEIVNRLFISFAFFTIKHAVLPTSITFAPLEILLLNFQTDHVFGIVTI